MGRNVESNRRGYNIRAKLYPSIIDEQTERLIKRDYAKPIIFYAKDYIDFEFVRNEYGGIVSKNIVAGSIETMDFKEGQVKINDTIEYGNKRYNVENVRYITNNQQSEVRNRVATKTIIKLGAAIDE